MGIYAAMATVAMTGAIRSVGVAGADDSTEAHAAKLGVKL
jgi:hypothetical protein